ncbi:MAG: NmrA family NAD(P)-binding protein [Pseudomonadota bacterium]
MALVSVVGASGRQGLAQMEQLRAAGYEVRAISRNADAFRGTAFEDVEVRPADLFDQASLPKAFEGSDAIFFNHPVQARAQRAELAEAVGIAGKAVGVKRVVWNTSSWIPDRPGDPFTYGWNTDGINRLFRTGVPATVFGGVLFMDNLLTNWVRPKVLHEGVFIYPHGPKVRANWISLDDVARIMIASLDRPDFEGSWMNIGGSEALQGADVAAALGEALGRDVRFQYSSPAQFGTDLADAFGDNMPAERKAQFAKDIEAFYTYNNDSPTRPFEVDVAYQQSRLPGFQPERLVDWAKRQDWSDEAHRPSGG